MKTYEVLIKALDVLESSEKTELIDAVIDAALNRIKDQIITTKSIDKTIELKKTYEELKVLKYRTRKLNSSTIKEDFSKFIEPFSV